MKHIFVLFGLFVFSVVACGQEFNSTYGKPLIVLTESNPWAMVIGAEVPSFALYEKGQIIYKKVENKRLKYYEVTLSKSALDSVINFLGISDSIYKLPNRITASDATDQPDNDLILNFDSLKIISVYGKIGIKLEDRAGTPKQFLTVYDHIKKFNNAFAKEWLPSKIEVMFWEYDYALNKRPWIKGFPDLNSPTTVQRHEDSYSVYIDKKDFNVFRKYYLSLGEKQAVEINGKKMAVAYRLPFPNIK